MATNSQGTAAREFATQQVHYLRRGITFADDGKTVFFANPLPKGALILKALSGVQVNEAFNGGASNYVDLGPSDDPGTNLWATQLTLAAIGFVPFDELVNLEVAADTIAAALVTSTAGATTGKAELIIAFLPDNDL